MNIFPGYLEMITKIITEQSNIKIDPSEYLSQIASSTIDIKFEKIDFGGKMKFHQYSWESIEKKSPRTSLVLGFVIRDDQTMPLTVTIREDDPKNKYGNVLTLEIPLKVVTKETE